jgi:nicotinate-nucleotide pyrophosphorylase (carboxylating)
VTEDAVRFDDLSLRALLRLALAEDLGDGDVSSRSTVAADALGSATIRAKQELVVAGTETLAPLWEMVDAAVRVELHAADGDRLGQGGALATLRGPVRSLLAGERVCLNLLGRLCGVATLTARYVAAVAGTRAKILDTRKTTPGMRMLEKAAVVAGGGHNHRFGLYDQILIKDNHVDAAGGVAEAVRRARAQRPDMRIEVEARDEAEFRAALEQRADIVLLDNMTHEQIRSCVEAAAGRAELEVSGGVTLDNVAAYAALGVDRISVGALTHSAPCADLHMKLDKP